MAHEISVWKRMSWRRQCHEESILLREAEAEGREVLVIASQAGVAGRAMGPAPLEKSGGAAWPLFLQTLLAWLSDFLEIPRHTTNSLLSFLSCFYELQLFANKDPRWYPEELFLPVSVNPKEHKEGTYTFLQTLAYLSCPWLKTLNTHQVKGNGST